MPFYDVTRGTAAAGYTTNGTGGTSSTHLWAKTATSQETLSIMGIFCAGRFNTAGGAQFRLNYNTGTTASGGTAVTANPRNVRVAPASGSTWANDVSAITAGTTLTNRLTVGFAQTGGMGGWVPTVPGDAFQMMPAATNPVDIEFTSLATSASVPFDATIEFCEGTN